MPTLCGIFTYPKITAAGRSNAAASAYASPGKKSTEELKIWMKTAVPITGDADSKIPNRENTLPVQNLNTDNKNLYNRKKMFLFFFEGKKFVSVELSIKFFFKFVLMLQDGKMYFCADHTYVLREAMCLEDIGVRHSFPYICFCPKDIV